VSPRSGRAFPTTGAVTRTQPPARGKPRHGVPWSRPGHAQSVRLRPARCARGRCRLRGSEPSFRRRPGPAEGSDPGGRHRGHAEPACLRNKPCWAAGTLTASVRAGAGVITGDSDEQAVPREGGEEGEAVRAGARGVPVPPGPSLSTHCCLCVERPRSCLSFGAGQFSRGSKLGVPGQVSFSGTFLGEDQQVALRSRRLDNRITPASLHLLSALGAAALTFPSCW
jgi:hypothetical protein